MFENEPTHNLIDYSKWACIKTYTPNRGRCGARAGKGAQNEENVIKIWLGAKITNAEISTGYCNIIRKCIRSVCVCAHREWAGVWPKKFYLHRFIIGSLNRPQLQKLISILCTISNANLIKSHTKPNRFINCNCNRCKLRCDISIHVAGKLSNACNNIRCNSWVCIVDVFKTLNIMFGT